MGRFCIICETKRPNERFKGRGLGSVVCRKCRTNPSIDINKRLLERELVGFWRQSLISVKNLKRLTELCDSSDDDIKELARLTKDVGIARPGKRKRMRWLKENKPELFDRVRSNCYLGWDPEEC